MKFNKKWSNIIVLFLPFVFCFFLSKINIVVSFFTLCLILIFVWYAGYCDGKKAVPNEEKFNQYVDYKRKLKSILVYGGKFFVCICILGVVAFHTQSYLSGNTIVNVNVITFLVMAITILKISGYNNGYIEDFN